MPPAALCRPFVIARSRRRRGNPRATLCLHHDRRDGRNRRSMDCFTAFAMTSVRGGVPVRRGEGCRFTCPPSTRHCEEPEATWQSTDRTSPPPQPPRWAEPSVHGLLHCVRNDECEGWSAGATGRGVPLHLPPLHSSLRGAKRRGNPGTVPRLHHNPRDGRNRHALECLSAFAMTSGEADAGTSPGTGPG